MEPKARYETKSGTWSDYDPMGYHYVIDHLHPGGVPRVVYWGLKAQCDEYVSLREQTDAMQLALDLGEHPTIVKTRAEVAAKEVAA